MSASADDPRLLSVASAIADGTGVNWKDIAEQLDPAQFAVVDELRALEGFKTVNDVLPSRWGRFLLTAELGRGVFGRVFEARDPDLQVDVALKVIRVPKTDESQGLKEARLLAKLNHPNVVRIYGVERIADEAGIVMELIRGRTLSQVVHATGPLAANEAAVIGMDVCRAVAAVHGAGMIHGDIKANNVMREHGGRTILMDFGAGRMLDHAVRSEGDFAGTPVYLAPEVFGGAERTKASDIYSIGVLLYYLVTASYPVEGATGTEVARRHHRRVPRRALRDARPDLPDGFVRVVERALAERPDDRFQGAGALEAALAEAVSSKPVPPKPTPRPRALVLVLAAVVLAIAFGGYRMLRVTDSTVGVAPLSVATAAVAGEYRIEAALYVERAGVDVRLRQGMPVAPGDKLSLHVRSSVPAHVYVVNEDEQGAGYLLFPLAGQVVTNPLAAGVDHRLPGPQDGERLSWQVTSAGGREHFIIFANTSPLSSFEQVFAALPRPARDTPVQSVSLSPEAVVVLRGVGGVTQASTAAVGSAGLARDFATPLIDGEETVRGVWIRRVTLENPVR
jgi:predicted Ser/Thr protein kinase